MKQNANREQESATPAFRLADFFPYRLAMLSNRVSNLIAREYADKFDLTVPEWRVIAVLFEPGRLTASGISDITLMDRVRVTRTLKQLTNKGLIIREASQTDGRSVYIALTRRGRDIYHEVIPRARAYERELLGALSATERNALDRAIEKLNARLAELEE